MNLMLLNHVVKLLHKKTLKTLLFKRIELTNPILNLAGGLSPQTPHSQPTHGHFGKAKVLVSKTLLKITSKITCRISSQFHEFLVAGTSLIITN